MRVENLSLTLLPCYRTKFRGFLGEARCAMMAKMLRHCGQVLRLVLPCAVLASGHVAAQPAIIPEPNHKFLSEEEGSKQIIETIQKINIADQQLASAMFLKILAETMAPPSPMVISRRSSAVHNLFSIHEAKRPE